MRGPGPLSHAMSKNIAEKPSKILGHVPPWEFLEHSVLQKDRPWEERVIISKGNTRAPQMRKSSCCFPQTPCSSREQEGEEKPSKKLTTC